MRGTVLAAGAVALAGVGMVVGAQSASADTGLDGEVSPERFRAVMPGPESGHQQAVSAPPATDLGPTSVRLTGLPAPSVDVPPTDQTVGQWYQAGGGAPVSAAPVSDSVPGTQPMMVEAADALEVIDTRGIGPVSPAPGAHAPVADTPVDPVVSPVSTALVAEPGSSGVTIGGLSSLNLGTSSVLTTLTQWYQAPAGGDDGQVFAPGTDLGPNDVPDVSTPDPSGLDLGALSTLFGRDFDWSQAAGGPVNIPMAPIAFQQPGVMTIINLGDSYASGEGAGAYANDGTWLGLTDTPAHQSLSNKAWVMAGELESRTGMQWDVVDLSHSGSITASRESSYVPLGSPELEELDIWARGDVSKIVTLEQQIDYLEQMYPNGLPPDAVVLIGIGGNDIGFGMVARQAMILNGSAEGARQSIENARGAMPTAFARATEQGKRVIDMTPGGGTVFITGYPYLATVDDDLTIYGCAGICSQEDVLGFFGQETAYRPGPDLRALQDLSDVEYDKMDDALRSYAELQGKSITIEYVPSSELTDGMAPYINGRANPDGEITTFLHNADGWTTSVQESIHPTPAWHRMVGEDLADRYMATPSGQALADPAGGHIDDGASGPSLSDMLLDGYSFGTDATAITSWPTSDSFVWYDTGLSGDLIGWYGSGGAGSVGDLMCSAPPEWLAVNGFDTDALGLSVSPNLSDTLIDGYSFDSDAPIDGYSFDVGPSFAFMSGSPINAWSADFWPTTTITTSSGAESSGFFSGAMLMSICLDIFKYAGTDVGVRDDEALRLAVDTVKLFL